MHTVSLCANLPYLHPITLIKGISVLAFWKEVADEFFWKKPATAPMLQYNFDVTKGSVYVKYMEGAKTNMCYNVLDRHVREGSLGEKVAYYW